MKRIFMIIFGCFAFLVGLIIHGWGAGAIYFCSFPGYAGLRVAAASIYLLTVILWIVLNRKHTKAFLLSLLGFPVVAVWFSALKPKADGLYPPELTMPHAQINGDTITLYDVRNNDYRTEDDFDLRYETRTYHLSGLRTIDVFVNY